MKRSLSILFVLFLAGCYAKVETPDGKLPVEFMAHAGQLVGNYVGEFNGQPVQIQVALDSEGRPAAVPSVDLLGEACGTQVGAMKSVEYDGDRQGRRVKSLRLNMAFNRGQCEFMVAGQELSLEFGKNREGAITLKPRIYSHTDSWDSYECHTTGGNAEDGPNMECGMETTSVTVYVDGSLIKQ